MPPAASSSSSSSRARANGACSRHDDVHVDLRLRVLRVVEVEQRLVADDPDRDRGDGSGQRPTEPETLERAAGRNVRPRDRSAARAAVGLQDVAVDPQRALAECLEIRHGAQRPPDQALDLDGPPAEPPARRLALRAIAGRRGQQRVLGGQPTAALAVEPARHALLHGRGAQHLRLPLREEHRSVWLLEEVGLELERAQLVRPAGVGAHQAAAVSSASSTRSTSSIGSWRKRAPSARKTSGSPVVRNR
jgi:hypothetical protein